MELRQAKIRRRRLALGGLTLAFGISFLGLIGTLMASEIVAVQSIKLPERSVYDNYDDYETLSAGDFEPGLATIDETFAHAVGTIYLTYDDGPSEYTALLLDILKKHNVKATFFVTGYGDDDLILREHNEGHTVALHSFTHKYSLIYTSTDAYFTDLGQVKARVKNITGEDANIIRFPGGSSNTVSAKYDGPVRIMSILSQEVLNRGYIYFDWNVDSNDAGDIDSADQVYTNVVSHLKEGTNVVLQHDTKGFSMEAVERIIEYGLSNGYDFKALESDSPAIRHNVNN